MAEKSFPLENTLYSAEDAQLWMATRTSGVYANDDFPLTANGTMTVTLGLGQAWLKYGRFNGCAYANTTAKTFTLDMSDSQYTRIDRLCIRVEPLNNACYAYIKKGTPSETPTPPALQADSAAYEISPYEITVKAGATGINASDITDKRLDESVCGLMRDGVTRIDTSVINAQVSGFVRELQTNLEQVYAGVEKVNIINFALTLGADAWSASEPYTQTVAAQGLLASDDPFMDLNLYGVTDVNEMRELRDARDCLLKMEPQANQLVFIASQKPLIDIPIKVKVVR